MNKLRSDSIFCKLTPEQVERLEDWLFEDKLGYKDVLERVEKEFGVKGSQSGLSRFYQRLAVERSQEGMVEMVGACVAATGLAQPSGVLQSGMLTLAYKCAVELMVKTPGNVRELTALLRVLMSAQAMEMKRVEFERREERIREAKLEQEREAAEKKKRDNELFEEMRRQNAELEERARRRKEERLAKLAAEREKNGSGEGQKEKSATAPALLEGEGLKVVVNVPETGGSEGALDEPTSLIPSLSPSGGEGEGSGEERNYADNGGAERP